MLFNAFDNNVIDTRNNTAFLLVNKYPYIFLRSTEHTKLVDDCAGCIVLMTMLMTVLMTVLMTLMTVLC
jgi:hypothetical protein